MEIKRIDAGITDVDGVYCCGIKEGKYGLGIVKCKGKVAGVFTLNKLKAAPVIVTMEHIKGGEIEGIIVNSGNANAFTGEQGIKNAKRMAEMLAERLGVDASKIAVASTGVIGVQLDMGWIETTFESIFPSLNSSRDAAHSFAKAIVTTDAFTKEYAVKAGDVIIAGVAKGAGMIAPNMATMLAFIFTDADFESHELQEMLKNAVDVSFNVTVVDGDTSTNDMVLLVATGKKKVDRDVFQQGLNEVCINLAKMIAMDGEGASKLIEVYVRGAKSKEDAFKAARSVVSSTLVKTAVFGNDPNWGRIIAALGYSGADVDDCITLVLEGEAGSVKLLDRGEIMNTRQKAKEIMRNSKEIKFVIDLHKGSEEGYAIGCDLTHDYVNLNAKYTT
ncbi:bifunctional ornithine acetyltransferase/N-acetylglutamate synthase [Archaeoglobus veneficus]|uniref:Arginine biosynthesis bifunctional protein ArgJ n=1 Tax=Archaeoglobus veneficus (strain DSM 11195 / SNP6) TaxID=693661 RepID=F2KRM0_ARCVS|nr:bifunctional ornithine acetyltransferase/N-acetylglutamate synthase [Archaeoglobus veneficus]AEA46785.1 Arginine biosynthesis bifunctional protein ArgJ [Archaeoglobus veneficus SNP6]